MREAVRVLFIISHDKSNGSRAILLLPKIVTPGLMDLISMSRTILTALFVVLVGADGVYSTVRQLMSQAITGTDPARAKNLMSRKSQVP